ncbi:MAG: nucleolar zinc-finger protein [Vezdaea aestivalis]|nr:MAG: nucleolar zinc-finger protein [Vezdaea aestivalis]
MSSGELFQDVGKQVSGMQRAAEPLPVTIDTTTPTTDGAPDSKDADEDVRIGDEIESLCMNCEENGITRLLLTKIPYFREVIIMSFYCPHCHFKNSEVQSAGEIQERGCKSTLKLRVPGDFARQVVKSDSCVARFEELELEIPAGRGQLSNVEGLLRMTVEDLEFGQPSRRSLQPRIFEKLEVVIEKAKGMLEGKAFPFTFSIDDPAGNSFVEPPLDNNDGSWSRSEYNRTPAQNEMLSLRADDEKAPSNVQAQMVPQIPGAPGEALEDAEIVADEIYSFPASCPGCAKPCSTHMKMVDIPHFKQVVIMSTACEHCGYKSNEVKTGGAVPDKGRRITLKVQDAEDLSRDILKSESCVLICPELKLHVEPGTLGGRFTTVEGILSQVRNDLKSQIFHGVGKEDSTAHGGDSAESESKAKWVAFFADLDAGISGEKPFTMILQDPLASSYVQSLFAPDPDPQIATEDYERTEEEKEDLGLADIKTEGYEPDE